MTSQIPPITDQKFGMFPDAKHLPKAVRADVEKLLALRTKALDAREAAVAAQARIGQVEAEAIKQATEKLLAGKDAEPEADAVDKARRDFGQSVRNLKAIEGAITQLEARLMVAFKANLDESHELAAGIVEDARAGYLKSLDAAAEARRKFYEAASIEAFSHAFDGERIPAIVGYGQRVPDEAPWNVLRRELERPVVDARPGPGLNVRMPQPAASASPNPGLPAGMRF